VRRGDTKELRAVLPLAELPFEQPKERLAYQRGRLLEMSRAQTEFVFSDGGWQTPLITPALDAYLQQAPLVRMPNDPLYPT
jgi:hypothetical protein